MREIAFLVEDDAHRQVIGAHYPIKSTSGTVTRNVLLKPFEGIGYHLCLAKLNMQKTLFATMHMDRHAREERSF